MITPQRLIPHKAGGSSWWLGNRKWMMLMVQPTVRKRTMSMLQPIVGLEDTGVTEMQLLNWCGEGVKTFVPGEKLLWFLLMAEKYDMSPCTF